MRKSLFTSVFGEKCLPNLAPWLQPAIMQILSSSLGILPNPLLHIPMQCKSRSHDLMLHAPCSMHNTQPPIPAQTPPTQPNPPQPNHDTPIKSMTNPLMRWSPRDPQIIKDSTLILPLNQRPLSQFHAPMRPQDILIQPPLVKPHPHRTSQ